jgi:anhydro-N-acetylmuramic acid kinase
MSKLFRAIGLMSGTSMDGIDLAFIETDGENVVTPLGASETSYSENQRQLLREAITVAADWKMGDPMPKAVADAEALVTTAHGQAVRSFMEKQGLSSIDVDLIGFHGQTVLHQPDRRRTVQIGVGAELAKMTGIDVVNDFRAADVAAGGQGAPFAPLFHKALASSMKNDFPIAVLNLGGVGNVTWLGADDDILAFDTGPANGLIDDWVHQSGAGSMDIDGEIAAKGAIDERVLAEMLDQPFFDLAPPKSLDRLDFSMAPVSGLSLEDGAATLTAFTAACVARSREHMSTLPSRWIVCGGGRKNPTLMQMLSERLNCPVDPAEAVGWRGDELEAEAFAYLAIRSVHGLPLSLPGTTGVPEPQMGGTFCPAHLVV